jgi:hypothetical protein
MRLATPTSDINELAGAATELLHRLSVRGVQSVDLAVTTIEAASLFRRNEADTKPLQRLHRG